MYATAASSLLMPETTAAGAAALVSTTTGSSRSSSMNARTFARRLPKPRKAYQHCETSIGAICDFDHRDVLFEVPYGTLVKTGFDNLITCGRCASATGWGWDVLRVIPPAILTGQAAGIASAIALESNTAITSISVPALQKYLAETGVMIHFDDTLIPVEQRNIEKVTPEGHI